MNTKFHTDNAAPCWACSGTVATYTVDSEVSLVGVFCISCAMGDLFTRSRDLTTAAECSAAHRKAVQS